MTDAPEHARAAGRVARNTALRAIAEASMKVVAVAFFVVLARAFDAETLGEYVFALAVVQLLWPVAGFGLDRLLVRDVSRDPAAVDRLFYDTAALKLAAGVAGTGVAALAVWQLDYSADVTSLVVVLGLSQALGLVAANAQSVFQAYERMEAYFYATVPKGIVSALVGIAVVWAGGSIVGVALAGLVVSLLGTALAFAILYRGFARPRLALRPGRWMHLARSAAPLGVQEVIGQVVFRIDVVLLSLLTTSVVVGAYGAGYRILEATLFVAWSVGSSVLPMYSYSTRSTTPSLDRVFAGSLKFALALMVPAGVVLAVCSEAVVDLLFGLPEYEGTVNVLRWLALAIVVYPVGHLAGALLAVRRPGRVAIGSAAAVAVFNVLLNLLLIPRHGAVGAAAATFATELLLAVLFVGLIRGEVGRIPWRWVLAAPAAAGGLAALVMLPIAGRLELALPLGVAVYLGSLVFVERSNLRRDFAAVWTAAREPAARPSSPASSWSEPA